MRSILDSFIEQIKQTPTTIEFDAVMAIINHYYDYQPTGFTNGLSDNIITNQAATNEGSCKIFAFSHLHQLSQAETLACFGRYYREDVLKHPQHTDHQNIRQFILSGSKGITFEHFPLTLKTAL
ncbi:HopJ type III effector protein [Photobacterium aquimaris]|uniref:HopJ type III effector protein n=1 Tax=Photobacterium aquimaris TaxID=512643 RepID=UPI000B41CE9F